MDLTAQRGGSLRWMEYARRSMQRLGFLKWVLSLASTSRVQNLEAGLPVSRPRRAEKIIFLWRMKSEEYKISQGEHTRESG